MEIAETQKSVSREVTLGPGVSTHDLQLGIENPKLWNPIHHGTQHLYTVVVTLDDDGDSQSVIRRTGVRRVDVDQSPHPVEGSYFTLKINNRPVFCKGGNWVPPDLLYSTVTRERYRELVDIALEANFNMLRVWGGGEFLPRAVFEACDEAGILVWHDFLFACAKYPGDDPAFAAEVRKEVCHAVRDNAHHPSLVVWCGNNEIEWGDWDWGYDREYKTHPHYAMFHHDIPKIVHDEDPSKFFWTSSPHSPDFKHPNDPTVGDQHPWGVSILNPGGADFWTYRTYVDRFANEGGVIGASSPATIRQFLPEEQQE
jgi:beta-mannosidase